MTTVPFGTFIKNENKKQAKLLTLVLLIATKYFHNEI